MIVELVRASTTDVFYGSSEAHVNMVNPTISIPRHLRQVGHQLSFKNVS